MKFKEVIIVVLIMLICAMGMLIYMIINDSMEVSSVPIIGNLVENVYHKNIEEDNEKKNSNQQLKTEKTEDKQKNIEENNNAQIVNEEVNVKQRSESENNCNVVVGNYTSTNEKVYATTNVNIRAFDNTICNKKGLLQSDESIIRNGIGDNGWSRVLFYGEEAYIASNYLTKEKPPEKIPVEISIKERNIDASKPMVALTFDDGPNGSATPKILDVLEKYNAVATFFDLGTCMENYPDITKREEQIGCEVGTHTYSHQNLNNLSENEIQNDIFEASKAYEQTLGHKLSLVRPPYGNANITVRRVLKYPLIGWDVDSLDWKLKNKEKIISKINETTDFDGRIILMHSIYNATADAVAELVPQLINKGYQLVTISEMAKYKGVTLKTSTMYYNFR